MPVPSVPGEARLDPHRKTLAVVQGVSLGVMNGEQRIDAVLDTGATYCVVPTDVALLLGFNKQNRLGTRPVNVVGGVKNMDLHTMEYMRVGTATAYRVDFLVSDINRQNRLLMLLGLSFLRRFAATTLDLDGGRVVFRGSK